MTQNEIDISQAPIIGITGMRNPEEKKRRNAYYG